jgi:hypothetical protein
LSQATFTTALTISELEASYPRCPEMLAGWQQVASPNEQNWQNRAIRAGETTKCRLESKQSAQGGKLGSSGGFLQTPGLPSA